MAWSCPTRLEGLECLMWPLHRPLSYHQPDQHIRPSVKNFVATWLTSFLFVVCICVHCATCMTKAWQRFWRIKTQIGQTGSMVSNSARVKICSIDSRDCSYELYIHGWDRIVHCKDHVALSSFWVLRLQWRSEELVQRPGQTRPDQTRKNPEILDRWGFIFCPFWKGATCKEDQQGWECQHQPQRTQDSCWLALKMRQ